MTRGLVQIYHPRKICYNCGKLRSHLEKDCTSSRVNFPKQSFHLAVKKKRNHCFNGDSLEAVGVIPKVEVSSEDREYLQPMSTDDREKLAMISLTDDQIYELLETN